MGMWALCGHCGREMVVLKKRTQQEHKHNILMKSLVCIGSVHPSESGTIAVFQGEKGESYVDEKGNVFNTFNILDRYLFPFSSIITLIDPNLIGCSHGDTSAARFE